MSGNICFLPGAIAENLFLGEISFFIKTLLLHFLTIAVPVHLPFHTLAAVEAVRRIC